MTLTISLWRQGADGHAELELIEGGAGLAGLERTRSELWGAPALEASLALDYLPRLATGDLWVQPIELDVFQAECERCIDAAASISSATGWSEAYVVSRLRNLVAAIELARRSGAGVVVD